MSRSDRFTTIGSPLYGKEVPLDWKRMTPQAKRRALVACGLAETGGGGSHNNVQPFICVNVAIKL